MHIACYKQQDRRKDGSNALLSSWSNGGYLTVVGFAKFAFELTFSRLEIAQLPNVLVSIIMWSVIDSTKEILKDKVQFDACATNCILLRTIGWFEVRR